MEQTVEQTDAAQKKNGMIGSGVIDPYYVTIDQKEGKADEIRIRRVSRLL